MAVGHVLGTINTYVLLTLLYIIMLVWVRVWWLVTRGDPLGQRLHLQDDQGTSWRDPDGPHTPTHSDLEHIF